MSTVYDFNSASSTNIHGILNCCRFFSNSVFTKIQFPPVSVQRTNITANISCFSFITNKLNQMLRDIDTKGITDLTCFLVVNL